MNGWTDGWIDGWMDECVSEWIWKHIPKLQHPFCAGTSAFYFLMSSLPFPQWLLPHPSPSRAQTIPRRKAQISSACLPVPAMGLFTDYVAAVLIVFAFVIRSVLKPSPEDYFRGTRSHPISRVGLRRPPRQLTMTAVALFCSYYLSGLCWALPKHDHSFSQPACDIDAILTSISQMRAPRHRGGLAQGQVNSNGQSWIWIQAVWVQKPCPQTLQSISSCSKSVFLSVEFSSSCEISILRFMWGLQLVPNCKAGRCGEGGCILGRGNISIFECEWCIQVLEIVLQGAAGCALRKSSVSTLDTMSPGRRDRGPAPEGWVWAQGSCDSHTLASAVEGLMLKLCFSGGQLFLVAFISFLNNKDKKKIKFRN